MDESLESLFRSDYMPHGHCYWWKPEILWLNVVSDLFIAFAYFSIPIAIYYFVKRREDVQFKGVFILFSLFILFCGITHVVSIFVIWNGIYGIHGLTKLATATVSCITAYKVFQSIPLALGLPTQDDLKQAYEKVNQEKLERLKLESKAKEEAMLRESTNIAHVGVFSFGKNGEVLVANDAACKIFESSKAELESKTIEELLEVEFVTNASKGESKTAIKHINLRELWQLQSDKFGAEKLSHVVYALTQNGHRTPISFKLSSSQIKYEISDELGTTFASFQDISEQLSYQKALAESEATTRSIIDSLPVGMHVFERSDDSLILTGYNKAADRILGVKHKELLSKDIEQAFPDLMGKGISERYKNIAKEGGHWSDQSINYEYNKIKGIYDVQCFQSVKNTAIVLFEDVTEQKLAKQAIAEKELFIKTAFNASITGVLVFNFVTQRIEFVNESFTDITGYAIDEAVDIDELAMADLIHPDDKQSAFKHWQTIQNSDTNAIIHFNFRLKHADGHYIWCMAKDVVFEKDAQGKVIRYMSSFLDISEMKQMQDNLIKLKDTAETASAAKSTFLANMSHEIRTPMNAILGLTNVVLRMDLGGKQRDYLSRVEAASQSLLSLLNDILDYSKIEAGKLKINREIFELNFVINNCTGLFGFLAEQKGIEFIVTKDTGLSKYYLGDPIRLSQILNNLLGNAVKFTKQGFIQLRVSVAENDSNHELTFEVKDSGIGMTMQQSESLFEAFSQADSSISRQYGGTGLGLAISRSLTHLMNGSLTFHSKIDEGSVFTVTLPFPPADYAEMHKLDLSRDNENIVEYGQGTGFEIVEFDDVKALVVEDNATNQLVAEEFLTQLNIQSVCVNNGLEAINAVESDLYDFILMDLQMPVMDGYSATKVIRETQRGKDIPIIAMSAAVSESDIEKVLASGMNSHLPKPFNLPLLFNRLAEFIGHKKSENRVLPASKVWDLAKYPKDFNIPDAMRKVGDDEGLYVKLVQSFAEDFEDTIKDISEVFEQKDYDAVQLYAHTIKGLAESMGATDLFHEARHVENEYISGNFVDPNRLFEKIEQAIDSIKAVHFESDNAFIPAKGGNKALALEYIAKLRLDLTSSKFVAVEDITMELSAIAEFVEAHLIEDLITTVKKLDYSSSVSILDKIETCVLNLQ
ncbi:ATP-binding protein [Glaciecola sp. MF2-115]|uniref:ATP-binding protein n=1 Tax=Glaciecola sp. MF2-115 TaxID=3384827 RepID=UPI0039A3DF99